MGKRLKKAWSPVAVRRQGFSIVALTLAACGHRMDVPYQFLDGSTVAVTRSSPRGTTVYYNLHRSQTETVRLAEAELSSGAGFTKTTLDESVIYKSQFVAVILNKGRIDSTLRHIRGTSEDWTAVTVLTAPKAKR